MQNNVWVFSDRDNGENTLGIDDNSSLVLDDTSLKVLLGLRNLKLSFAKTSDASLSLPSNVPENSIVKINKTTSPSLQVSYSNNNTYVYRNEETIFTYTNGAWSASVTHSEVEEPANIIAPKVDGQNIQANFILSALSASSNSIVVNLKANINTPKISLPTTGVTTGASVTINKEGNSLSVLVLTQLQKDDRSSTDPLIGQLEIPEGTSSYSYDGKQWRLTTDVSKLTIYPREYLFSGHASSVLPDDIKYYLSKTNDLTVSSYADSCMEAVYLPHEGIATNAKLKLNILFSCGTVVFGGDNTQVASLRKPSKTSVVVDMIGIAKAKLRTLVFDGTSWSFDGKKSIKNIRQTLSQPISANTLKAYFNTATKVVLTIPANVNVASLILPSGIDIGSVLVVQREGTISQIFKHPTKVMNNGRVVISVTASKTTFIYSQSGWSRPILPRENGEDLDKSYIKNKFTVDGLNVNIDLTSSMTHPSISLPTSGIIAGSSITINKQDSSTSVLVLTELQKDDRVNKTPVIGQLEIPQGVSSYSYDGNKWNLVTNVPHLTIYPRKYLFSGHPSSILSSHIKDALSKTNDLTIKTYDGFCTNSIYLPHNGVPVGAKVTIDVTFSCGMIVFGGNNDKVASLGKISPESKVLTYIAPNEVKKVELTFDGTVWQNSIKQNEIELVISKVTPSISAYDLQTYFGGVKKIIYEIKASLGSIELPANTNEGAVLVIDKKDSSDTVVHNSDGTILETLKGGKKTFTYTSGAWSVSN